MRKFKFNPWAANPANPTNPAKTEERQGSPSAKILLKVAKKPAKDTDGPDNDEKLATFSRKLAGREACKIKNLSRISSFSKGEAPKKIFSAKKRRRPKIQLVTKSMVESWRVGRRWILENLGELEAAGWTRHELLRAGRFRYPCGTWGPAFTGYWAQKGVKIEVEVSGAIVWAWVDATGRTVRQRAARIPTTAKTNEEGQPNDSK